MPSTSSHVSASCTQYFYYQQNLLDKAIALYQKALALKPDYELARNNLTIAQELLQQ